MKRAGKGAKGSKASENAAASKLEDGRAGQVEPKGSVWQEEKWNLVLLTTLYMIQGVPLGLSSGSMPYLLQAKASYTQIGIFSLATYPYSFKLFWSPIVDSLYSSRIGRRKSWIIPIQSTTAVVLMLSSNWVQQQLEAANVVNVTYLFFLLVLLMATQDIAVDGWALTMLKPHNVEYASTCQTVGMNIGYFTSFTVFLAFNDPSFCNAFIRSVPQEKGLLELSTYMQLWGFIFGLVTLVVALGKTEGRGARGVEGATEEEEEGGDSEEGGVWGAYRQLLAVLNLRAVQQLSLVLLTMRLGVLAAEGASALKLLEKGVSKESLALLVLIDFPCELASAVLAGRWASHAGQPMKPWMVGMWIRLVMGAATTCLVGVFPTEAPGIPAATPATHLWLFVSLGALGLLTSFSSTLMFTAIGSFFNKISDPDMGGAYLTLLNTIANMGIVLPKFGMFWLMDRLTKRQCFASEGELAMLLDAVCPWGKPVPGEETPCSLAGGECRMTRDGFFPLSYGLLIMGVAAAFVYRVYMPRLEALPLRSWRVDLKQL